MDHELAMMAAVVGLGIAWLIYGLAKVLDSMFRHRKDLHHG